MLAQITLAAMRRAERTLGATSALAVARAAVPAARADERRTILLAALGVAARGGDREAFLELAREWERSNTDADPRVHSLVARLCDAGDRDLALGLARGELTRRRSATALLAVAALAPADSALLDEALRVATDAERPHVERARLVSGTIDDASAAVSAMSSATAHDVVALAPVALGARGLYARVGVLDRLLEVCETDPTALRIALAHADLRGRALSSIERDRIASIASAASRQDIVRALVGDASRADTDARAALAGIAPSGKDAALHALAAVVRGDATDLLFAALAIEPPSAAGWTAAMAALARPSPPADVLDCIERWLAANVAPPRGFTTLAGLIAKHGHEPLVERVMDRAARANEPGAYAYRAAVLAHRALLAYEADDLALAEGLLRRSLAIDPEP